MVYSNGLYIIGPNLAPLRDMTLWNLIDHEFDLSRSLKVKSDSAI